MSRFSFPPSLCILEEPLRAGQLGDAKLRETNNSRWDDNTIATPTIALRTHHRRRLLGCCHGRRTNLADCDLHR